MTREKSEFDTFFCFFSQRLRILTVNAQSNDVLLSESEMAQRVRHQAVKWSWTVQNKQAGWCRSLMGTSVRTGEELRGGPSGCARENQRQGGGRRKERDGRAYSQTFTAPSLLKQSKERAGPMPACRAAHWRQYWHPCITKTLSSLLSQSADLWILWRDYFSVKNVLFNNSTNKDVKKIW